MARTVARSTGLPRSRPPASATNTGCTCRISIAMRHLPSARARIRRLVDPVNQPEFGPAGRDRADYSHKLAAQLGQRQGCELFLEAERHDPVHRRKEGARQDMACV